MSDAIGAGDFSPESDRGERTMSKGTMSQAQKDAMAAGRAAAKSGKASGESARVSLDDKIAALQAQADAGDANAARVMPLVEAFQAAVLDAKAAAKAATKKLRKLVNAFS